MLHFKPPRITARFRAAGTAYESTVKVLLGALIFIIDSVF